MIGCRPLDYITGSCPDFFSQPLKTGSAYLNSFQSTLPQNDHVPSGCYQFGHVAPVACDILLELAPPAVRVGCWRGTVSAAGMTVPETAVNEDGHLPLGQDDIRAARQILDVQAVSEALSVQESSHHHFRAGVSGPDPCHHSRSGFPINHIYHADDPAQSSAFLRDGSSCPFCPVNCPVPWTKSATTIASCLAR